MGGRPQVAGLPILASLVVVAFASPIAVLPAAAEIRVQLPGAESKPKIIKRRRYSRRYIGQPALPARNPARIPVEAALAPDADRASNEAGDVPPGETAEATPSAEPDSRTSAPETGDDGDPRAAELEPAEDASADKVATTEPARDTETDATENAKASNDDDDAREAKAAPDTVTAEASATSERAESESAGSAPPDGDAADASADKVATTEPAADEDTDSTEDAKASTKDTADDVRDDASRSVVLEISPPPKDSLPPKDSADASKPKDAMPSADEPSAEVYSGAAKPTETEASDLASNESEAAGVEAESEQVAEPAPPPAHPVVAEIRTKLEDPKLSKTVASADLKALRAFYGTYEGPPLWVTDEGFTDKAKAVMDEIRKADEWGLNADKYDLPPKNDLLADPNAIADDELQLSKTILKYARHAQVGRLTPSRVSKLFDQHPRPRDPKAVLKEVADAADPTSYLTGLHPQNKQFKGLKSALASARASAGARGIDPSSDRNVQLITMNMERWRWMPRKLGNYHVLNNVPELQVRVIKGGKTVYREKTIVGKYKYATPFFSAPMRNIVFHPNWTVPPTIVKEDIAPKLKGPGGGGFFGAQSKKATLRRYGLEVSYRGKPIDADRVDWKKENVHKYRFTQAPGPANVLGQFKFNFPNKHAIYMHDTVQRELFSRQTRTLSHGCIRVHQPARLAALLLGEDKGWTMSNVQRLLATRNTKAISLNRSVPVHLTYFTTTVDDSTGLREFEDIYGLDNVMASKMFENPAHFPKPVISPVAESRTSTRPTRSRPRRSANGGIDNFISGIFGN